MRVSQWTMEVGRCSLVEGIDEDHESAAACRGGFAGSVHCLGSAPLKRWLQTELVTDARPPRFALTELRRQGTPRADWR